MKSLLQICGFFLACHLLCAAEPSGLEIHGISETSAPGTKGYALEGAAKNGNPVFLEPAVLLDGHGVKAATATYGQQGWSVLIRLTDEGAKQFEAITSAHVGKQLAIVVDGKLLSAPVVRETIRGNGVEISGTFTEAQCHAFTESINRSAAK